MTQSGNTIVAPVDLPRVDEKHHRGIFCDFREVVESRIAQLRANPTATNQETARFFDYLLSEVDSREYADIQRYYLSQDKLEPDKDIAKYLDPITWFESKLRIARKLRLDSEPPLKILDFGTGPGHFPVVARFYGHDVTGTELPKRSMGVDKSGHLYDALCGIYRVRRVSHTIRTDEPVGDFGTRYDLVTAFLVAFSIDDGKRPWTAQNWHYFLASLNRDVLTVEGRLFMTLANHKLTDASWNYLAELAEWSEHKSKQILISNFDSLR